MKEVCDLIETLALAYIVAGTVVGAVWACGRFIVAMNRLVPGRPTKYEYGPLPPGPAPETAWRHRKGGLYRAVGVGRVEATLEPCVVYRSQETGELWVRPHAEFTDGRFTEVTKNGV